MPTLSHVIVNKFKSYIRIVVEETYISDPRSYEHYWTSSWNKYT